MNNREGLFTVDRGVFKHPLFDNGKPYTELEAWLWLLSEAKWRDGRYRVTSKSRALVTLKRGELSSAIRGMADVWNWSKSSVKRYIDLLKSETMIETRIETESGTGQIVISIRNYNIYQDFERYRGTDRGTPDGTGSGTANNENLGQMRDGSGTDAGQYITPDNTSIDSLTTEISAGARDDELGDDQRLTSDPSSDGENLKRTDQQDDDTEPEKVNTSARELVPVDESNMQKTHTAGSADAGDVVDRDACTRPVKAEIGGALITPTFLDKRKLTRDSVVKAVGSVAFIHKADDAPILVDNWIATGVPLGVIVDAASAAMNQPSRMQADALRNIVAEWSAENVEGVRDAAAAQNRGASAKAGSVTGAVRRLRAGRDVRGQRGDA